MPELQVFEFEILVTSDPGYFLTTSRNPSASTKQCRSDHVVAGVSGHTHRIFSHGAAFKRGITAILPIRHIRTALCYKMLSYRRETALQGAL